MKQIRDISYDVEDCVVVDDFAHRLPRDTARGDIIYCATVVSWAYDVVTWWPRRDIASTVAALKARTQQIGERRARYGVKNPKSGNGGPAEAATGFDAAENQLTSLQLVCTKMPVGVDAEMVDLGKWVSIISAEEEEEDKAAPSSVTKTQQSQTKRSSSDKEAAQPATKPKKLEPPNKDVLSIVGFGGVGKTTIATALYQKYGDQFKRRARVTVSQSSNIEAILGSILSQVMPQYDDDGPEWDVIVPEEVSGGTSEKTQADIQRMNKKELEEELKKHLAEYR
jgi:disease resistance protein RPM1